mgnify:CR=1 FL=1
MKVALLGPGIISIPPPGWGAVEILIWDYYNALKYQGIQVNIINKIRKNSYEQSNLNSVYCRELIDEINNGKYDFVHIHYDCLFHIIPFLSCKTIGFTSHYPYINDKNYHSQDGFTNIFDFMVSNKTSINFVLAKKDYQYLLEEGAIENKLYLLENGVSTENFEFSNNPMNKSRTIYLGKISDRKGQHKYCKLENIDIVGPGGNILLNWKGEWTREDVYSKLSQYGNLLLLSKGEADPLVVKEALMCGLGVVVNESSAKNLSQEKFITIINDNNMDDLLMVQEAIEYNRKISITMREEIRKYAESKFGWNHLIKKYLKIINNN